MARVEDKMSKGQIAQSGKAANPAKGKAVKADPKELATQLVLKWGRNCCNWC
jgi:hypothetical protein